MEKLDTVYGEDLLYIFNAQDTKDGIPLAIVRDDIEIKPMEGNKIMHYSDDFESLVTCKLPTKNRRVAQMISLEKSIALLQKIDYGVLSFTYEEVPYSLGLNHVYMNNKLYFHGAKKGFKLNAIHCPVSFLVVDDLGVNEARSTHNHESVMVQGTMREVTDSQEKQLVLKQLMLDLAPTNHKKITENMAKGVAILALDIKYLHGKSHIRH